MTSLFNLPRSAVWGFIDKDSKRIWITQSINVIVGLMNNVNHMRKRVHKVKDLNDWQKFEYIELESLRPLSKSSRLLRVNYWTKHYLDQGYTILSKAGITYQVKINAKYDKKKRKYYLYVYLQNRHYRKHLVGVFKHMDDVKAFVDKYYKNGVITSMTVSDNELTKQALDNL